MKTTLKYLLDKEWSMGNGQCPECCGVSEKWLGHFNHLDSTKLGHEKDCVIADMLIEHGIKPLFIGKSKLKQKYEIYVTDNGFVGVREVKKRMRNDNKI